MPILSSADKKERYATYNRVWYARNREKVLRKKALERQANQEKFHARDRANYRVHKEHRHAYDKKRWATHKEQLSAIARQKAYGVSPEDYDRLLRQQKGRCPGCLRTPKEEKLCVDHEHGTGKIRGLLCKKCNLTLGTARDNSEVLRRLALYLEQA